MGSYDRPGRSGLLGGGTWAAAIIVAGCIALWVAVDIAQRDDGTAPSREPSEVEGSDEVSALQVAVLACDVEGVEAELDKGARQFAGGRFRLFEEGASLDSAVRCGPEMAALLTTYVVENAGGDPVLQAAVGTQDVAIVAAVLDAGADVDGVDDAGDSALLVASTGGAATIVEHLLVAGADPNLANENGHTPLLRAVGTGGLDAVRLLLAAGASTEAELEVGVLELLAGLPLDADATVEEFEAQVELAAEAFGGKVDTSGLPSGSWGHARPLFIAAAQGDPAMVQLLLDAGADPTVPGGLAGNLPVDAARIMGHDDVIALLGG